MSYATQLLESFSKLQSVKKTKRVRENLSASEYDIEVMDSFDPYYFAEEFYDELCKAGFRQEADLILDSEDEAEIESAVNYILDRFLYEGKYRLDIHPEGALVAVKA